MTLTCHFIQRSNLVEFVSWCEKIVRAIWKRLSRITTSFSQNWLRPLWMIGSLKLHKNKADENYKSDDRDHHANYCWIQWNPFIFILIFETFNDERRFCFRPNKLSFSFYWFNSNFFSRLLVIDYDHWCDVFFFFSLFTIKIQRNKRCMDLDSDPCCSWRLKYDHLYSCAALKCLFPLFSSPFE